jgi:hypothetical protein
MLFLISDHRRAASLVWLTTDKRARGPPQPLHASRVDSPWRTSVHWFGRGSSESKVTAEKPYFDYVIGFAAACHDATTEKPQPAIIHESPPRCYPNFR